MSGGWGGQARLYLVSAPLFDPISRAFVVPPPRLRWAGHSRTPRSGLQTRCGRRHLLLRMRSRPHRPPMRSHRSRRRSRPTLRTAIFGTRARKTTTTTTAPAAAGWTAGGQGGWTPAAESGKTRVASRGSARWGASVAAEVAAIWTLTARRYRSSSLFTPRWATNFRALQKTLTCPSPKTKQRFRSRRFWFLFYVLPRYLTYYTRYRGVLWSSSPTAPRRWRSYLGTPRAGGWCRASRVCLGSTCTTWLAWLMTWSG